MSKKDFLFFFDQTHSHGFEIHDICLEGESFSFLIDRREEEKNADELESYCETEENSK